MIALNRRRVYIPKEDEGDRFTLLYEWNAKHWSSGLWYENNNVYSFEKQGTPTKDTDSDNNPYLLLNYTNYFRALSNMGKFPIPRNWMFEITFMRTVNAQKSWYMADWGYLGNAASGGAGFFMKANGTLAFGSKPTNNTASGSITHSSTLSDNVKYTAKFGCQMYSSTQDLNWIEVNGVKEYASDAHASFTGLTMPTLGRYIGRGAIPNTSYHDGTGRIYSVKIYQDNKTV